MSFIQTAGPTYESQMSTPWVVCPRPQPQARLRLFCFPYAGRGPSLFHTWPEQFPNEIELCLVHLPGREQRFGEPPYTRMETLLEALIPALSPWLDQPCYAIFGHSMGALIGFELARQLIKQGRPAPRHLFVSGSSAPHLPRRAPLLYTLPDAALKEALRQSGGTPREILDHQELLELLLPMLRADMTLCATYHYRDGEPLVCPLSVFGGQDDQTVGPEALAAWRGQTTATCTVRDYPGDHFFLHSQAPQLVQAMLYDLYQHGLLPSARMTGGS